MSNPPLLTPYTPPIIVHHMGAMDGWPYPANSLEAIRACLEAGAKFIEVDITALADEDYLLVHDSVLEHETDGEGEVSQCTAERARTLNIRFQPYRVALLSDVVNLLLDFGGQARLQLDFKSVLPFREDEPIRRLLRLIRPLGERVIVSTGADWHLRAMRRLAPWLDLGFDIGYYLDYRPSDTHIDPRVPPRTRGAYGYHDEHPLAWQALMHKADYLADRCMALTGHVPGCSIFYLNYRLIVQSLNDGFNWAEALHEHGIRLDAWTMDVGNPEAESNVSRLAAAGVDQFTTNTPKALARLLGVS